MFATRVLSELLFGVPPTDTATYLAVAAGSLAVALVASWLPGPPRGAGGPDARAALRVASPRASTPPVEQHGGYPGVVPESPSCREPPIRSPFQHVRGRVQSGVVSARVGLTASLPASTPPAIRDAVSLVAEAWTESLGSRLVSLVLFGSVARGEACDSSDVDLLVVATGFPPSLRDRRRELLDAWSRVRSERGLAAVEWNLVTKTPEEARVRSPLYLDLVDDAILLVDRDGFFRAVLDGMRARMRELGSRRVFLPDGGWYWDLRPGLRFGEVVEI